MADIISGVLNTDSLFKGLDATTTAIIFIFVLVVVVSVIIFVMYYLSFKWPVRVREVINGKTRIKADMAKRIKTKDGVAYWKLRGYNVRIPEPPNEAIDLTAKGQNTAEFYRLPDGTFMPITDNFNLERFDVAEFSKTHPKFKPFPTEQRSLMVHEAYETAAYKKKTLMETLLAMAPILAIVLILVLFMIFFNDAVAPTIELGRSNLKIQEQNALIQKENQVIVTQLAAIINKIDPAYLEDIMRANNLTIAGIKTTLPPQ